MLNSAILEVVIGLIFIYWLLVMICSTMNELIVAMIGLRTRELQKAFAVCWKGAANPPINPAQPALCKMFSIIRSFAV